MCLIDLLGVGGLIVGENSGSEDECDRRGLFSLLKSNIVDAG